MTAPDLARLEAVIERAWADESVRNTDETRAAVESTIDLLDRGLVRVAEPAPECATSGADPRAGWTVNAWVKKAVLLYFPLRDVEVVEVGIYEYRDKIPLKTGYEALGVRVVPPAVVRYGAFVGRDAVLMPSYTNIGAYVDGGTMVDTWATVGSCAQIGKHVHLSGGVGIGGVLEPVQAAPVIVEDGAFIGSRSLVVEGVHVGREAVVGAGVVLTASTPLIDVTGPEPIEHRGYVPPRAVVVSGSRPKTFPAGEYGMACALIIGERKASTDRKTSLNAALRDYGVTV
jgi:2,3,4,5-tetrahydropyridine-2-carboxylate N-succinyltransferase